MSDLPKIVLDRLGASVPGEAHPEADVLAAFAEQALSGAEREDVVRHLSRCGVCREVLALTLPPLEAVAQPKAAAEQTSPLRASDRPQSWFVWPNLRWAALAASVVVVGSVLLLRPEKTTDSTPGTGNLAAQGTAQPSTLDANSNPVVLPPAELIGNRARTPAANAGIATAPERRSSRHAEQALARMQNETASASGSPADKTSLYSNARKVHDSLDSAKPAMQVPAAPVTATNEIVTADRVPASSEAVEVTGAAIEVQPAPAVGTLIARNDTPAPPIAKAKEAVKENADLKGELQKAEPEKKAIMAIEVSDSAFANQTQLSKVAKDEAVPQWSLALGKLRRSLDTGKTWQPVSQPQTQLLSFGARGSDIWAGGHNGMLFHSIDSGTTWTTIKPATKAAALSGDIVAIDLRTETEMALSTSTGESWTTTDGGKTWDKK